MTIDHTRPLTGVILAIATVATAIYVFAWYFKNPDIPPGVTVEATPAAEVKHEAPSVTIKPPSVKVYKPGVKGKLKLPTHITNDDNQHVLASVQTPNDERQHTFTAVMDQQSGKVQVFDLVQPSPWLAVNTKSEVGVYYGIKDGEQALRIEGRQELLQVKALHLGAIASADMTRGGLESFVGVGAWARW